MVSAHKLHCTNILKRYEKITKNKHNSQRSSWYHHHINWFHLRPLSHLTLSWLIYLRATVCCVLCCGRFFISRNRCQRYCAALGAELFFRVKGNGARLPKSNIRCVRWDISHWKCILCPFHNIIIIYHRICIFINVIIYDWKFEYKIKWV